MQRIIIIIANVRPIQSHPSPNAKLKIISELMMRPTVSATI